MAKITKSQLKAVVKECLVELLAEGLSDNVSSLAKKKQTAKRLRVKEKRLTEHRKKFETAVESTVSNITDDPIMQSILQDTAKTTLQEQIAGDSPGDGGALRSGNSVAGIDLNDIFSDSDGNWSKLAFDD